MGKQEAPVLSYIAAGRRKDAADDGTGNDTEVGHHMELTSMK